jgi:hypothetical protein
LSPASALLRAELDSPDALAAALGADVPASWPPQLYDADAIQYMLDWCDSHPNDIAWGFYYVLEAPVTEGARPLAVGAGGNKGAPDESGAVEIGYSIVPERQRLGPPARRWMVGWLMRSVMRECRAYWRTHSSASNHRSEYCALPVSHSPARVLIRRSHQRCSTSSLARRMLTMEFAGM